MCDDVIEMNCLITQDFMNFIYLSRSKYQSVNVKKGF